MIEGKLPEFPEEDARGIGYHVAQTALGAADVALPGAGYALQQIVGHFVGEPLAKRREEWFRLVGAVIVQMQERFDDFDPANLSQNEEFISCVYEATDLAMKTHREFKREALKNAISNTALGFTLDEAVRGRFMSCINAFSEAHIRVLSVLHNPGAYEACVRAASNIYMGAQISVIRGEITKEAVPDAVMTVIVSDLTREGFIDGGLNTMVSGGSLLAARTTDTGNAFLRFVTAPFGLTA
ncbi:hypothetical protein EFQ99_05130 [Rhizobium vallis]|uniref:Uncharacterized protein n=1 Tax=Rhizobium vallis TaxID=634290 RepID=A0A3S0RDG7_9HYPH|nr:hypothetical protein [Rhizobium vallis]RUM27565.1 hypothetical protein EFQ99_05130 [Rhizobium vallis]